MANKPTNTLPQKTITAGDTKVYTSGPKEIVFHRVTEHQLKLLEDANRDGLSNSMWTLFGASLGSALPACRHIFHAYFTNPSIPLSRFDFLETMFFLIPLALGILIALVSRRRKNSTTAIIEEIRKQPKTLTSTIKGNP